jgi:hypothetical protein
VGVVVELTIIPLDWELLDDGGKLGGGENLTQAPGLLEDKKFPS